MARQNLVHRRNPGYPAIGRVHFSVTEHPTSIWIAQQITEAFPWDTAPLYMIRDRDGVYGKAARERLAGMGITEVLTAPRSPWQSPYVERVIGSIRRQCRHAYRPGRATP